MHGAASWPTPSTGRDGSGVAAVARYLADTSALARLNRPAVDAALSPLIETGEVATCGMIELEVLHSARSPGDYARLQQQLREGCSRSRIARLS